MTGGYLWTNGLYQELFMVISCRRCRFRVKQPKHACRCFFNHFVVSPHVLVSVKKCWIISQAHYCSNYCCCCCFIASLLTLYLLYILYMFLLFRMCVYLCSRVYCYNLSMLLWFVFVISYQIDKEYKTILKES